MNIEELLQQKKYAISCTDPVSANKIINNPHAPSVDKARLIYIDFEVSTDELIQAESLAGRTIDKSSFCYTSDNPSLAKDKLIKSRMSLFQLQQYIQKNNLTFPEDFKQKLQKIYENFDRNQPNTNLNLSGKSEEKISKKKRQEAKVNKAHSLSLQTHIKKYIEKNTKEMQEWTVSPPTDNLENSLKYTQVMTTEKDSKTVSGFDVYDDYITIPCKINNQDNIDKTKSIQQAIAFLKTEGYQEIEIKGNPEDVKTALEITLNDGLLPSGANEEITQIINETINNNPKLQSTYQKIKESLSSTIALNPKENSNKNKFFSQTKHSSKTEEDDQKKSPQNSIKTTNFVKFNENIANETPATRPRRNSV
jgi:hypothetical protein